MTSKRTSRPSEDDAEHRSVALNIYLIGYRKLYEEVRQLMEKRIAEMEAEYEASVAGNRVSYTNTSRSGWSDDPAERKREMKRRLAKRKRGTQSVAMRATHPRDKNHPGHAAWLKKTKRSHKKFWAGMTVAERKARLAKMQEGRKPVVKLAVAS